MVTRRRFPTGIALAIATLGLALLPGVLPRTAAGIVLTQFLPGFALQRCLGVRVRFGSLPDLLNCCAASLAITPLALRLAGSIWPFDRPHVLGVLVGVAAGLALLGSLRSRAAAPPAWSPMHPAALCLILVVVVLLVPTLTIGPTADGGETRVKGWDLNNHLAIAESIAARGLPPRNPFLDTDSPFYYHAFFHILLGAALLIAGQDPHPYLLICLLTLLLSAVFLSTFYRVVSELTGNHRVALLSLPFVSIVGGFDLLPMAGRWILGRTATGPPVEFLLRHWNVDGWVSNQGMLVPSFFSDFYWSPHAVAAATVFLLALFYLRQAGTGRGGIVVAAACLASMAGYNGYVALGGAATLVLLAGLDLSRYLLSRTGTVRDILRRSLMAAALAVLLGLPVLGLYLSGRTDTDKFRWVFPGPSVPLQIILEFGPALILGLTGVAKLRRGDREIGELTPFFLMVVISLPIICFLASTGENNDLAMRVSMLAWVGLAVFSGVALNDIFPVSSAAARLSPVSRVAVMTILALGCLSIAWFAIGASVAKPALPADEVAAGRWVRSHVPPGGLVQGSPFRNAPDLVYLTGRPAVLSDAWAARLFYSTPEDVARRLNTLREAFSTADPVRACQVLKPLGLAVLIVGPPERKDIPHLDPSDPWPCLSEAYRRGEYSVYRVR